MNMSSVARPGLKASVKTSARSHTARGLGQRHAFTQHNLRTNRVSLASSHRRVQPTLAVLDKPRSPSGDTRGPDLIHPHPLQDGNPERSPDNISEDPWTNPKWANTDWTVYRGVAYDLGPFMKAHPGGEWLLNLALKRDSTALFESYHLRPDVATAHLKRLPKIEGFPVAAVPRSPYPNDSPLYNAIRDRVREELFDGAAVPKHKTGSEWAAAVILATAAVAWAAYLWTPSLITGALLGVAGAWIGLTIQHCGNHGAMSPNKYINGLLGSTTDFIGGSSLMWRYHHQVSHHIHCNDTDMDEDVFSAFPLLRFDARMPKYWYHNFQHIYMWLAFPFMQLSFEIGDLKAVFEGRTAGATLHGATFAEYAYLAVGKVLHWGGLLAPLALGASAAVVAPAILAYIFTQGVVLASLFAVSHNLESTKDPKWLETEELRNDWAVQQCVTSANWGHKIGCFFTGGLNLQIEHHLFPAISFMHYPAISKIAREEAEKRGVPYVHHKTLPSILAEFQSYMKRAGQAPAPPGNAMPYRGGMAPQPREAVTGLA